MVICKKIFNEDETEMKKMSKNEEQMKNLQENYLPTEEAICMAINSGKVHGVLMHCIFYDKRLKSFLVVDMHGVSDYETKSEKKLREKIQKNPQRFIKFPQFTSRDNWEIMLEFAEEKDDENLISALNGNNAFSDFYSEINASRSLSTEFGMFQKNYYNEIFANWREEHGITEPIQF